MTGLRKWSLSLLSLILSFILGWHGNWDAGGWAMVLLVVLGSHSAASVLMSRSKTPVKRSG